MRTLAVILLTTAAPLLAQAEIVVRDGESINTPPARFFPVAGNRNGNPSGVVVRSMKPIRSDSAAMANGYFRIDRSRTIPTAPLVIHVPTTEQTVANNNMPRVIYGNRRPETTPRDPTPAATTNALRSTAPTGTLAAGSSEPILSLFDGESNAQHTSFRDALNAGGMRGASPTTIAHKWPIELTTKQRLSSNYGFRASPFDAHTQFHGGIDIASPIGTPVLASANGTVSNVGIEGGYGRTITVLHPDGSESRYSHLNTENVKTGQIVAAGQTIGTVGASGHATGPHLDYRLTKDGVSIDPLTVLNGQTGAPAVAQNNLGKPTVTAARSERIIVVQ
jgi:murein DD-endopeptidase MepM/ murein hydrolase activator NlpD